jgi:hypothetical protein
MPEGVEAFAPAQDFVLLLGWVWFQSRIKNQQSKIPNPIPLLSRFLCTTIDQILLGPRRISLLPFESNFSFPLLSALLLSLCPLG